MTTRHYDAVVIGRSIGALTAAALLARRDFRLLVVGQGQRPATYRFEQRVLCRRPFTLLAGSSPAFRRVLHELAQSQRFQRRTNPLDPMFCLLAPGRRVAVPPDVDLFSREVDREFPEVRQLVDELYGTFAQVNGAADAAFELDNVWPPGTLWERFETGRVAARLPLVDRNADQDLLAKFPAGHPFRALALLPAAFASDLALTGEQLSPFALARLHGAWTRGIDALSRGEDELSDFLIERVQSHGGECELDQKAVSLVVRRNRIAGVVLDGHDEPLSTEHVICDQPGEMVAHLSAGQGITKRARRDWPRLMARAGRFVVSLIARKALLPDPLGVESFLLPKLVGRPDPRRPVLHVQRVAPEAHDPALAERGEVLLVAETLLPQSGTLTLFEARDAVLSTLREHLPFMDEHLVLVDSPHDGMPLEDYSDGTRRAIDRIHVVESSPGPEPMQPLWSVDPMGYLDLGGEPVRGPIPGSFLVGSTVLPALGQEGQLLAAWSAARIITRKNRAREKMRREMWSRIETG